MIQEYEFSLDATVNGIPLHIEAMCRENTGYNREELHEILDAMIDAVGGKDDAK